MQEAGFSDAIVDRFFRPFLGGIFFDHDLQVSSRLFEFVMRCLATGANCLPAKGIGAVAGQLAEKLPEGSIRTGQPSDCNAHQNSAQRGSASSFWAVDLCFDLNMNTAMQLCSPILFKATEARNLAGAIDSRSPTPIPAPRLCALSILPAAPRRRWADSHAA